MARSQPPAAGSTSYKLVLERAEDASPEVPLFYREQAYAVGAGTARGQAEQLLWERFADVASSLRQRPAGKVVKLAVFDHVFNQAPLRPPLVALTWKDWCGDPLVQIGVRTASMAPPEALMASIAAGASSNGASTLTNADGASLNGATHSLADRRVNGAPHASATEGGVSSDVRQNGADGASPSVASVPAGAATPTPGGQMGDATTEPPSSEAVPSARSADLVALGFPKLTESRAAVRRRIGEDLIGELFETMHELHYVVDVVSGAEFVIEALEATLPCEAALVHVFDINTQTFVVLRAWGPKAKDVLLFRTPDSDALIDLAMHRSSALRVDDAAGDPRFASGRWQALGVEVKTAVCGAVRQGGRYLGAIELVNPLGGTPFHDTEVNALDYICEQFAEFVADRPIVVDAELVLASA